MVDLLGSVFDFLAEMTSSVPWVYRGWVYLFFASYRREIGENWRRRGRAFRAFDIAMSCAFMVAEVAIVVIAARIK